MPYDANGCAIEWEPKPAPPGMLWKAVGLFLAALLAIAGTCWLTQQNAPQEPSQRLTLAIDATDPHSMHAWGLPSESDVVHWHVHGEWAYKDVEGNIRRFTSLPGEAWRWDELYDITWRPVFQH